MYAQKAMEYHDYATSETRTDAGPQVVVKRTLFLHPHPTIQSDVVTQDGLGRLQIASIEKYNKTSQKVVKLRDATRWMMGLEAIEKSDRFTFT